MKKKVCQIKKYFHETSIKIDSNGNLFTVQIINNDTIGFNILANNKLYIHQPYIPAINGDRGFKSAEDANRVANLIVGKLKKQCSSAFCFIRRIKTAWHYRLIWMLNDTILLK